MFSLLWPRPADQDGELPPGEPLHPVAGPRADRPDEVQQLPDAAGGSELRPGPVFSQRVLGGGGLGSVSVERPLRDPGQAEQDSPLC